MELSVSPNEPKLSLPTLEARNNYYVVPAGGRFHYFPIKAVEGTEDLPVIRLEKAPPIILDGFAIFKKKIYDVRSRDVLRCIVLKSREVSVKRDTSGRASNKPTNPIQDTAERASGKTVYDIGQQPVVSDVELEVHEAADASWKNQVESLLGIVSSKEGGEWEVESIAQP